MWAPTRKNSRFGTLGPKLGTRVFCQISERQPQPAVGGSMPQQSKCVLCVCPPSHPVLKNMTRSWQLGWAMARALQASKRAGGRARRQVRGSGERRHPPPPADLSATGASRHRRGVWVEAASRGGERRHASKGHCPPAARQALGAGLLVRGAILADVPHTAAVVADDLKATHVFPVCLEAHLALG